MLSFKIHIYNRRKHQAAVHIDFKFFKDTFRIPASEFIGYVDLRCDNKSLIASFVVRGRDFFIFTVEISSAADRVVQPPHKLG